MKNTNTLKSYFQTGDYPTEDQFADLIDSCLNLAENDVITGLTDNGDNSYTFQVLSNGNTQNVVLDLGNLSGDIPIASVIGLQAFIDQWHGLVDNRISTNSSDGKLQLNDPYVLGGNMAVIGTGTGTSNAASLTFLESNFATRSASLGMEGGGNFVIRHWGTGQNLMLSGAGGANALTFSGNKLWHSGNDGPNSGLDADTLDGVEGSDYSRLAFNTRNSGVTDSGKWTKIARVTLTSRFSDSTYNLRLVGSGSAIGNAILGDLTIRVKQQTAFGSDPYLDYKVYEYDSNIYEVGHVIVQNDPTTIVDFYLRNKSTYNTITGFISAFNGTISFFDLQPYSTTIPNLVAKPSIKIWTSANDGMGSGLDADTVDGLHSDSFFRKYLGLNGDANSYVADGAYSGRPFSSNHPPTGHGRMLVFGEKYQGLAQIFVEDQGHMYVRGLSWSGTWYPWHKVWSNGNDGHGSGLDADTLDGLQASSFMRSVSDGNYYGLVDPTGNSGNWIRTTQSGIIPYRPGGASSLGTPSWPFTTVHAQRFVAGYDAGIPNGMSCSNWFRSSGNTGWFNATHGGGIYMTDSSYVRVYANRAFRVDNSIMLYNGGRIRRGTHLSGFLEGSYHTVEPNHGKSNPIYVIGSTYIPAEDTLGNMYGIGYSHAPDCSFLNATDLGVNSTGWGLYIASDGNARIFLSAGSGDGYFKRDVYCEDIVTRGRVMVNSASSRNKLSVHGNGSDYAIGMQSGHHFGSLQDWAMTFQMNPTNGRGFWWGHTGHSNSHGAMALTNNGYLTLAKHMRVGFGDSDTASVGDSYAIQANGTMQATNFILSSDLRLKENIRDYQPKGMQVRWRCFDWIDGDKKQLGVVAQELQETHPEFVVEDEQGLLSVKYTDLLIAKMAEKDQQMAEKDEQMAKMQRQLDAIQALLEKHNTPIA